MWLCWRAVVVAVAAALTAVMMCVRWGAAQSHLLSLATAEPDYMCTQPWRRATVAKPWSGSEKAEGVNKLLLGQMKLPARLDLAQQPRWLSGLVDALQVWRLGEVLCTGSQLLEYSQLANKSTTWQHWHIPMEAKLPARDAPARKSAGAKRSIPQPSAPVAAAANFANGYGQGSAQSLPGDPRSSTREFATPHSGFNAAESSMVRSWQAQGAAAAGGRAAAAVQQQPPAHSSQAPLQQQHTQQQQQQRHHQRHASAAAAEVEDYGEEGFEDYSDEFEGQFLSFGLHHSGGSKLLHVQHTSMLHSLPLRLPRCSCYYVCPLLLLPTHSGGHGASRVAQAPAERHRRV
jgi:hypothetical protein